MQPDYLTTTETARLLRVHPRSVIRWVLRGQLAGAVRRRSGGAWRYLVPRASALAMLEGLRQPAASTVRPALPATAEVLKGFGLERYLK